MMLGALIDKFSDETVAEEEPFVADEILDQLEGLIDPLLVVLFIGKLEQLDPNSTVVEIG